MTWDMVSKTMFLLVLNSISYEDNYEGEFEQRSIDIYNELYM